MINYRLKINSDTIWSTSTLYINGLSLEGKCLIKRWIKYTLNKYIRYHLPSTDKDSIVIDPVHAQVFVIVLESLVVFAIGEGET